MSKSKRYDVEFKKQTVAYMVENNKSLAQTAREIGISVSTLSVWRNKYHPNPGEQVTPA